MKLRVRFQSLSVHQATFQNVSRSYAVKTPRNQRPKASVLNRRSPELWRGEAAEKEFQLPARGDPVLRFLGEDPP
jgi:hypothetical protein